VDHNIINPKITVLMPVYNCELYIKEAIESILNQTFSDFEFLIIDDASTDLTPSIIKSYNDSRIKLIEKPDNSGYTNSLNYGLSIANGDYIARMDGDDFSFPERFHKQISFLDSNRDVFLCGTSYHIMERDKNIILPESHENIKSALLKANCIVHPSVMFRNSRDNKSSVCYDSLKEPAEDYDLWVRLLTFGKLYNLPEILLNYRVHDSQVSQKRNDEQKNAALEVRLDLLNYLECAIDSNERFVLKKALNDENLNYQEIKDFIILKNKLIASNSNSFFEKNAFQKYLDSIEKKIFKDFFLKRDNYSPIIFFYYLKIRGNWKIKTKDEFKLLVKSLIFFKIKNE